MKFSKCVMALCAALVFSAQAQAATMIKLATLAPEGSAWMNIMNKLAQEVDKKTGGEVKFKIYANGVQGDEKDVVRKIRMGQLHAGGFTGVGIGEIAPAVRVLDAPFMFKSPAEIDLVYKAFDAELRKELQDKGYVLLGWTEVGLVYLYTNTPIRQPSDLKAVKMWMWEGDPVAEAALRSMNIAPVSLSVTDVMTSLQTGMINAVYGSPLSVIAMQWQTRTKYMFSLAITNASGALLVSKKQFDQISPANQKVVLDLSAQYMRELTLRTRADNQKTVEMLKKDGFIVTDPASPAVAEQFAQAGAIARRNLVGKLYPASLFDRVEKAVQDYRKAKK